MKEKFDKFLTDESTWGRTVRTIVQLALGVLASAITQLVAAGVPVFVSVLVAPLVMVVLTVLMSEIGKTKLTEMDGDRVKRD